MKISVMRSTLLCVLCSQSIVAYSATEEELEKKIELLEQRLTAIEEQPASQAAGQISDNSFNPAVSVILEGVYASYKNDPENYELPGYALGGEAGLAPEGFSLGHSEIILSSNIDDKFYGQFTLALAEHDGETELEIEEAYFETLALDYGFTIRGGRFYSAIGYLNQQHRHAWDFYDAPLIYSGLFGNQYFDDGLRLSFVVPADLYLELGSEVFAGGKYPAGGNHSDVGSWTAFVTWAEISVSVKAGRAASVTGQQIISNVSMAAMIMAVSVRYRSLAAIARSSASMPSINGRRMAITGSGT